MPIMLESALTSHVYIVSQILFSRFPNNFLAKLLGVWELIEESAQLAATSGFAYYVSPPRTLLLAPVHPIHTILYILFMTSVCAIFSKTWIEVPLAGSGPRDMAKQLKDQQLVHPGFLFTFQLTNMS
ncbi:SecY subunit domain containing protein [Lactarius tabidus]